ncbi:MAG: hypothetical protein M3Z28_03000 [Candidatus Dormibacteraeota bacterium]|nr:hypothetical protein [Candidatus Dormibacteraeota bacterium]
MRLLRPVLVFLVALAGVVDGGFILGAPLNAWLAPGPLIGYLPITLLFLGAAVGAALAATMAANVVVRTSRGLYLPVLAVTAVSAVAAALAEVWLEQHWLHASSRALLLLATMVLIAAIATTAGTRFRRPAPGHGRARSALMIGVLGVVVIAAILLAAIAYFASLAFSSFS